MTKRHNFLAAIAVILGGGMAFPIDGEAATSSHGQLVALLQTNGNCRVRLTPAWIGETKVTVRTGHFATGDSPAERPPTNALQFDWFVYSDPPPTNFNFGRVCISKDEGGSSVSSIHTFRSSLPTDDELTGVRSVTELKMTLGAPQGCTDVWGTNEELHSTTGWSFFVQKDETTVETVSIFCSTTRGNGETEWRVDSMKVTRGNARPKEKRAKTQLNKASHTIGAEAAPQHER